MKRRSFLKRAGAATAAAGAALLAACERKQEGGNGPAVQTDKAKFSWKLAHSFGPTAPVLGTNLPAMADDLRTMSGGALDIKVFGAGELVPAFGVFDAAVEGSIQMMYSAPYYWAGKVPFTQFVCSVPWGMTPQQVNAWMYHGGGLEVWQELYAKQGLIGFPAGNTGTQFGGWYRKEINSPEDLEGLKLRIPGLGGKMYTKVGVNVVLLPGPEIYPALERGVIDAAEWVGPFYDWNLGLHQAAEYYYFPGTHEPSTMNELTINLKAWESLPKELQEMVRHAAFKLNVNNLAEFDAKNEEHIQKIQDYGVKFRQFPDSVLQAFKKAADEINEEVADKDEDARQIYDSYKSFRDGIRAHFKVAEYAYLDALRAANLV